MNAKEILTNKSFCPLPWTGFIIQQNGDVKNCVLSKEIIGNIDAHPIEESLLELRKLDARRKLDSKLIFKELYD